MAAGFNPEGGSRNLRFATEHTHSDLHEASHGESFLDLALGRFLRPGLYVLDEPEAALSIHGQMVLARLIAESVEMGGQFLIATHSPFLLAYSGATVYELDDPEHFYQQLLDP